MAQSFALWAYSGPAASSAAALITGPIMSEIQRIVHPPYDVDVIRVAHQREQAQSKPGLAAQTRASGKISGSVSQHPRCEQFVSLIKRISLRRNASSP